MGEPIVQAEDQTMVLTTSARGGYLRRAMEIGAAGYVLKDAPIDELVTALRRVHAGERVVAPELAVAAWDRPNPLTDPEREILREVATGAANTARDQGWL